MKKIVQLFTIVASIIVLNSCNNKADASNTGTKTITAVQQTAAKKTDTSKVSYPPAKKLMVSYCSHSIKIVSGKTFSFPKNLKELGLKVEKNGDAYVLTDATDATAGNINNGSIIIGNGNVVTGRNITISQQGSNSTITVKGNVSGTIIQNGNIIVIGSGNTEPVTITVPDGIDLDASLSDDLMVTARIASLDIDISGSADVSIESSENVGSVDISGSGSVTIKKTGTVKDLHISGSGDIVIRQCSMVGKVSVSGSGEVDLPDGITPQSVRISGSGDVH